MKKSMSIIAAIALATAMVSSLPTFATDITQESESNSATVPVTYTMAESYTVTIPTDTVSLDGEGNGSIEINASNVFLAENKALDVTVKGTDADSWKLATSAGTKIEYSVKKGDADVAVGESVLNVASGTNSDSVTLEIEKPTDVKVAGTYTDTLTFTVDVKGIPAE